MSTRRPLQPRSPLSTNIPGAIYDHRLTREDSNGLSDMNHIPKNHAQDPADSMSLTSLENEGDDFDRLMIQNARDQRRMHDALQGKVQPFRKARVRSRAGVTLDNLERHNARNGTLPEANAHVKFESPSSSSDSTRSASALSAIPALQPPTTWGRKARVKRNWIRDIMKDEVLPQERQDDTIDRFTREATPPHADEVDLPLASVEDSPLSRKTSLQGTPASTRHRAFQDDWSIDLNEASLIASTPYIPRNTALDEIRQLEIESLREQAVTTARLDKIRDSAPGERRRPRSSSAKLANSQADGEGMKDAIPQTNRSPEQRHRAKTSSWQTIGKSRPVTGQGLENSPVVVYKRSSEIIGIVDTEQSHDANDGPKRPTHKREDSQNLLRRLARVSSSTPSPGKSTAPRPQTAPAKQSSPASHATGTERSNSAPLSSASAASAPPAEEPGSPSEPVATASRPNDHCSPNREDPEDRVAPVSSAGSRPPNTDATLGDVDRSILAPKTPVVTGAWVETHRAATIYRTSSQPASSSETAEESKPTTKSSNTQLSVLAKEVVEGALPEPSKSRIPRSALEAVVEEARANSQRHADDFGDSTINSLEEIIAPVANNPLSGDTDEDTLQGLQLPTSTPRNEAERLRQQELLHLHRMNERLRAARTSIRDASRGIQRVENRVEHVEETVVNGEKVRVVYRDCPCGAKGGHMQDWTFWKLFKTIFYDERLKPRRRGWGITFFSIFLITFFTWYFTENIACEIWCNPRYAYSYVGYGVDINAPRYPFVVPTMLYRTFIQPWGLPLFSFAIWTWRAISGDQFVESAAPTLASTTGTRIAQGIWQSQQAGTAIEEEGEEWVRMAADQVVRR